MQLWANKLNKIPHYLPFVGGIDDGVISLTNSQQWLCGETTCWHQVAGWSYAAEGSRRLMPGRDHLAAPDSGCFLIVSYDITICKHIIVHLPYIPQRWPPGRRQYVAGCDDVSSWVVSWLVTAIWGCNKYTLLLHNIRPAFSELSLSSNLPIVLQCL